MSDDGQRVVFWSHARNLVPEDVNDYPDVFLQDASFSTPISYCRGKINSVGCLPTMAYSGYLSISASGDLQLEAFNIVSQRPGLLLLGLSAAESPFSAGTLCLGAPLTRIALSSSGGNLASDCSGTYSFHFSPGSVGFDQLRPGTAVFSQFWFRDSAGTVNNRVGLTDAVAFSIGP